MGLMLFVAVSAASLLVTSWALEPEPFRPAPARLDEKEAVVQVYGADVWGFRGNFAIHTWVATKAHGAVGYQIYQVIGWRLRRTGSVVSISERVNPARPWAGSPAILLHEIRGPAAAALIDKVHEAALSYPFDREYKMWPGPNSNSFTAWIGLEVPELNMVLPTKALGKSWMHNEYPDIVAAYH